MRGLLREGSGASETGKEAQSINKFKKKIASGLLQKERDRDKRKEKLHIFKVRTQNPGICADPARIRGYLASGNFAREWEIWEREVQCLIEETIILPVSLA